MGRPIKRLADGTLVQGFQDGGDSLGAEINRTRGRSGYINLAGDNAASNWDYINRTLARDTEGIYETAAIKDAQVSGYLGEIADSDKTIEEKTVLLADMLRNTQSSSDIVEQILGIPKEEVNAFLTAGGFGPRGEVLNPTSD